MTTQKQTVGILLWKANEEFGMIVVRVLADLGYAVRHGTDPTTLDLPSLDTLLIYGPWGSIEPTVRLYHALPQQKRPKLVLWQSEQFPNPALPGFVWRAVGGFRSRLESVAFQNNENGHIMLRRGGAVLTHKLHRYRYYGDAIRYFNHNPDTLLAVWSSWTAQMLHNRGLQPLLAYMGSHPDLGRDLGLERDIPVLWLGKIGSDRRGRLLKRIRSELSQRGIELMVVDGVENPYVFGEDRTILLNRTKLVLNLLRERWDNTSMRFFLSAGNGAAVIGEPMLPHIPFRPGVHCIEAPIDQLSQTIAYYLAHETDRKAIADQAYSLAVKQLPMIDSVQRIMNELHARGPVESR